ncbi:helix-turn-helix domain-containing protein [Sporomusa acidovorans]|uniref:HTH cro/C1-type domain-containing protein n=1 Tax=Sporomusa acidovorans (strain ATCC 49682 / DSM 3132 / Mol) TaxID=1123286 RepID=A0ABZ3IWJ4_SPOA4|nr:helix-turn-helix transcriptional regulator [Sporomusa acidovorans]OZC22028.1 transcriptional repressor DicA [Sporomusa acidovorans DSM 3132]SDF69887.1 Helix-turn-helix [Sporomusa acidovorans]
MTEPNIIKRIKQIRAETGLSQDKFAKKIGVSPGNVSSWELGIALPGALALKSIQETLGYSIDWLLTGQGSSKFFGESNDNIADNPDLKEMTDVLKRLLNDKNRDIRSWTKVQFQKAFGGNSSTTKPEN